MINIDNNLIESDISITEALNKLEIAEIKTLFLTKRKKLIATITDGDIRRWILKNGKLDDKISKIANYNPKYVFEDDNINFEEYLSEMDIAAVPILDNKYRIIAIKSYNKHIFDMREKLQIPVVIMAGGLGTRLYPYTKILPKPLIPIGDIPITEHIINRFCEYGCREYYLVVNHKKNMIKAYFNDLEKDYTIEYVSEDIPLGTGGGVGLVRDKIKGPFILSNCDILIKENIKKIYDFHKEERNLITMICSLKNVKIPYGVIEIDEDGQIESMKEKPELSFLTNTGVYIVEPKVFDYIGDDEKIGFPDIIERCKNNGEKIGVYPISENSWLDMGQFDEMDKMKEKLGLE